MESLKRIIEPFISKELEIVIDGVKDNLFVFDWKKIEAEHELIMTKVKGMSEDQLGDFLLENETALMQISEYFMDEESEDKIDDDDWFPFGLLGLCHNPDSFAEISNNGLLLFDISKKDNDNPPIILYKDSKSKKIAENFSGLEISES